MKRLVIAILSLALLDSLLTMYSVTRGSFPLQVPVGPPTAYLSIYIHVPVAWTSYMLFTASMVSAVLLLARGNLGLDRYVYSFALVGLVFAGLTLITGSIWAKDSWGSYWNWDPRQTGVLLLFIAYAAYVVVRRSISDPERAVRVSAAYSIAAYVMVPLSFIAVRIAESLHPTPEDTRVFFSRPEVLQIFGLKALLVPAIGALSALALAKTKQASSRLGPKAIYVFPPAVLALGLAGAVQILGDYASPTFVVVNATLVDGKIATLTLSDGSSLYFDPPIEPPVDPPMTSEGKPSIVSHIVSLDGGLKIVVSWTVAANTIIYSLGVTLLLLALIRRV